MLKTLHWRQLQTEEAILWLTVKEFTILHSLLQWNRLHCNRAQLREGICCQLNATQCELQFSKSDNAGRYLCEHIFYKSLRCDAQRTIFIHVPILEKPYSAEKSAEGIKLLILCALEQL